MQTAIAAIFVFLLVVLLHELGHFTVAKLVGIKVNEFSIGMGPKLLQKTKGDTQYTLRLLPIGGYVKMEGEDENSDDPRSFSKVSPLARIAVVAAGAIMNFVLAIIVLSIVIFNTGMPTTTIGEIQQGSPAEYGGILPNDRIVIINNIEINSWDELSQTIGTSNPEEELEIVLIRDNQEHLLKIKPIEVEGRTIVGVSPKYERTVASALRGGIETTLLFLSIMFEFLGSLFRGSISTNDLSGPVGVISEIGKAANLGIIYVLYLLGFISVNLGFFNLLPIPALDGSRIVFILIELIRGKPIDPDKESFIHFIGFALLISLMLVVTYKDIIRINLF